MPRERGALDAGRDGGRAGGARRGTLRRPRWAGSAVGPGGRRRDGAAPPARARCARECRAARQPRERIDSPVRAGPDGGRFESGENSAFLVSLGPRDTDGGPPHPRVVVGRPQAGQRGGPIYALISYHNYTSPGGPDALECGVLGQPAGARGVRRRGAVAGRRGVPVRAARRSLGRAPLAVRDAPVDLLGRARPRRRPWAPIVAAARWRDLAGCLVVAAGGLNRAAGDRRRALRRVRPGGGHGELLRAAATGLSAVALAARARLSGAGGSPLAWRRRRT